MPAVNGPGGFKGHDAASFSEKPLNGLPVHIAECG
jgi:hypothetical protein